MKNIVNTKLWIASKIFSKKTIIAGHNLNLKYVRLKFTEIKYVFFFVIYCLIRLQVFGYNPSCFPGIEYGYYY